MRTPRQPTMSTDRPAGNRKPLPALGKLPPPLKNNGIVLGPLTTPSVHESWMVSFRRQIGELMDRNPLPLPRYRSKLKVSPDGIELSAICFQSSLRISTVVLKTLEPEAVMTKYLRRLPPLELTDSPNLLSR